MQTTDPRGYAILRENFSLICKSNLDPSSLARDLFAKGLITNGGLGGLVLGKQQKLQMILESVMANGAPGVFEQFVAIVKRDQAHQWLADKLEGTIS